MNVVGPWSWGTLILLFGVQVLDCPHCVDALCFQLELGKLLAGTVHE